MNAIEFEFQIFQNRFQFKKGSLQIIMILNAVNSSKAVIIRNEDKN